MHPISVKRAAKIPTIGVLAGVQMYYGTILGNFVGPLLHGVYAAAQKRRCNLLIAGGMDSSSYTAAHPAWPVLEAGVDFVPVGPWNTDGLIVFNPLFQESRSNYVQGLIADGHPIIFAATGERGPTVAIDNTGAIVQALQHLMDHGHKQIAFIAGYPNDVTGESAIRLRSFWQFVETHNLASDPKLIAYGSHGINGGREAMQQIIDSGIPFTAVLASNDESAIGAMEVLKNNGLRIPQDVAIIGIDDTFEAMTQTPPLTTFHSSPFRMGYQALELLLDYIEGKRSSLEDTTVPMQFVIRQSCGCQPNLMRIAIDDLGTSATGDTKVLLADRLAKTLAETALAGTQRLSTEETHSRCRRLVESFIESLSLEDPVAFLTALEDTLIRAEELGDDIYVWNSVLSRLEGDASLIQEMVGAANIRQQPETIIAEARIALTQHMERYHRHLIIRQKWIADQVGHLNSRLLSALDEAQVYEILASYLPQVGIKHMDVAFFEAKGDAVAWCSLRQVLEGDTELRFPSRQFPPQELYDQPYHLILLPIAGQDTSPGFVVFHATDMEICAHIVWQLVTFLKVVRLYREATHGRQLAEEANRLKSRFLSTVSHELRTPLNLIVGLSELLLKKDKDHSPDVSRDLRRIHASAQHLDGLIRDVLDLAQNEMGELKLASTSLNLPDVLNVVAAVGEQLVQEKGLEWQASIPNDLLRVWGDPTRLRQVVLNLISNAVKFTAQGTISLRVRTKGDDILVEVSDTGLGIPPQEQNVIFNEFRQSERTATLGFGGLGLGLAICKRLVELHGGSIGVRSSGEEGTGSIFYFTLPILKDPPKSNIPNAMPSDGVILLLAQPFGNGRKLQQYLIQQGFAVDVQPLKEENLLSPHFLDRQPGAVILEEGPGLERGWSVIKSLRENPTTRDVPVLIYSLDETQDSGSVFELNYITKPLNHAELIKALERQVIDRQSKKNAPTILIVDDEPSTVKLHARMIAAWSPASRILTAENGRIALDILHETHPDLVLLDLMMPELDGFGVLQAMRADPHSRDIPVIVLTGQTLTLEDMTNLGLGVTSVLKKGLFSASETIGLIESALLRSSGLGSEARRAVRKAIHYLHSNYMQPISLEETARHVSMSKEYLARCFRQEMGVTLVTYLNRYRVQQAKNMLERGESNLTEIALETGFSSSAYFSRVFRQEVGMSPTDYLKAVKS
jgi:signal transduction histidine kinase/DNA-binding LacI/PurR family transcriptional regulator/AraC-like DNA-binding protein